MPFDLLEGFIAAIEKAPDLETVRALLQREVQRLGFDSFTYSLIWPPEGPRLPLYISTYPGDWVRHYVDRDFRQIDLVWSHAVHTTRPFIWEDVRAAVTLTPEQKAYHGLSAEAGLGAGGGIPIHGPREAVAVFNVAKNSAPEPFRPLFLARRHELQLLALNAHERILELGLDRSFRAEAQLSQRQKDVLLWAIRGKTNWEIGEILGISEDTVRQHMIHVCRLLDTSNKAHAAAVAVMKKLVIP